MEEAPRVEILKRKNPSMPSLEHEEIEVYVSLYLRLTFQKSSGELISFMYRDRFYQKARMKRIDFMQRYFDIVHSIAE